MKRVIRWRCYSPHTNTVFARAFETRSEAWDYACSVVPQGDHFLVGDYITEVPDEFPDSDVPAGYEPDRTIDRLLNSRG